MSDLTISTGIIIQIISAIGCILVAEKRGGLPFVWFILGLIFGPLAFIVALTAGKQCQYCLFWIPKNAKVCGYCAREL